MLKCMPELPSIDHQQKAVRKGGQAGIVRSVQADPDYTYRPEPETTVDALRKVVGA